MQDIQEEFQAEREDLLDTIRQLSRQIKLKDLVRPLEHVSNVQLLVVFCMYNWCTVACTLSWFIAAFMPSHPARNTDKMQSNYAAVTCITCSNT